MVTGGMTTILGVTVDVGSVVAIAGALMFLVALLPAGWSRRKSATISTLEEQNVSQGHLIRTRDREIEDLEKALVGCQARADRAEQKIHAVEKELAGVKAAYLEQSKYSAPEAFVTIGKKLAAIEELLRAWLVVDAASGLMPREKPPT